MAGFLKKAVNAVKASVKGYIQTGTVTGAFASAMQSVRGSSSGVSPSKGASPVTESKAMNAQAPKAGDKSRSMSSGSNSMSKIMDFLKKYWWVALILIVVIGVVIFLSVRKKPMRKKSPARVAQAIKAGQARLAKNQLKKK